MSLLSEVRQRQEVKRAHRLLANVASTMTDRQMAEFASIFEMKSASEILATLQAVSVPQDRRLFLAIIASLPQGWTADRAGPALLGLLASAVRAGTTLSDEDARAMLTEADVEPTLIDQILTMVPRTADGAIEWATIGYAVGEVITTIFAPEFTALPMILGGAGLLGGAATDEDSPIVVSRPSRSAPRLSPSARGDAADDAVLGE